jgi:hypothetical protein
MKTTTKTAAEFTTLNAAQMSEVKGGYWLRIITGDGRTTVIWV